MLQESYSFVYVMLYQTSAGSCISVLERIWKLCLMMHRSSRLRSVVGSNVMRW